MREKQNKYFFKAIKILTIISLTVLSFNIFFILKESLVFFKQVSIIEFIFGRQWNPLKSPDGLSIFPIILATIYISFIGILIALPIGIGNAIVLSGYTNKKLKEIIKSIINILSGIPSVIYGFLGLVVLVKLFEVRFNFASGESVLAGGIVIAIMILPFIVSTCEESMSRIYKENIDVSKSLGISKSYFIRKIILPNSKRSILAAVVLSLSRAMGETMAVMMVIGNAVIMPSLFGKAKTIPGLIALEMGMVEVGSLHYHALYAAGFVLMFMLLIINIVLHIIKRKLIG